MATPPSWLRSRCHAHCNVQHPESPLRARSAAGVPVIHKSPAANLPLILLTKAVSFTSIPYISRMVFSLSRVDTPWEYLNITFYLMIDTSVVLLYQLQLIFTFPIPGTGIFISPKLLCTVFCEYPFRLLSVSLNL